MSTQALERPVGRKPKGETQSAPEKKNIKVAADLHRKLAVIAAHQGIDLFDLVDGLLRHETEREYVQIVRQDAR